MTREELLAELLITAPKSVRIKAFHWDPPNPTFVVRFNSGLSILGDAWPAEIDSIGVESWSRLFWKRHHTDLPIAQKARGETR